MEELSRNKCDSFQEFRIPYDCVKLPYVVKVTDYGRPVRKSPSLHGQKSTPTPKFLDTAEANSCRF